MTFVTLLTDKMDDCIIDMANFTKYSPFQNWIVTIFVKVLPVVRNPKTQEPLLRMWKLNPILIHILKSLQIYDQF